MLLHFLLKFRCNYYVSLPEYSPKHRMLVSQSFVSSAKASLYYCFAPLLRITNTETSGLKPSFSIVSLPTKNTARQEQNQYSLKHVERIGATDIRYRLNNGRRKTMVAHVFANHHVNITFSVNAYLNNGTSTMATEQSRKLLKQLT